MEKKLDMGIKTPLSGVDPTNNITIILGAGLAGLSAGFVLSNAGQKVVVLEGEPVVGGLAKTIVWGEFRFDLGGHRFFTNNLRVERFVRGLMGGELLEQMRKSKIYLHNKYFDYPIRFQNAILGLGFLSTLKMLSGYSLQGLRSLFKKASPISLEDWVVSRFGRPMFNLYFKEYSEKVWGIKCKKISAEWVAKRIKGLSLGVVIKDTLFRLNGNKIPTLTDKFLYPNLGIGRIAERLKETISNNGSNILMDTRVEQINHSDFRIEGIISRNCQHAFMSKGYQYISSIPITALIKMLHPQAPDDVLEAASKLCWRDVVIVTIMIDSKQVTKETWMYFPEKKVPFGRLHEPTNWSKDMAPPGKTLIVAEYFCFKGEKIWETSNQGLTELTIQCLVGLGFIKKDEVIDSTVIRVANAYPLLEVGYREHYDKVWDYLARFRNLHIIGRGGAFVYHNIDDVIESGLLIAEKIIGASA